MLFNSLEYGFFFLVVFTAHWLAPRSWRRPLLLLASYYFYASAIPQYLALILGLTAFNYGVGRWLARASGRRRAALLWLAIAGNLGSLAYFKYTGLLLGSIRPLLAGLPLLRPIALDWPVAQVLLPLGVSFFTFEFIHYAVEVYRRQPPIRNPVDFALFAAFFPTQIAGPIKRFPDFVKQLAHPQRLREIDIDGAVGLFLRGLVKKALIADTLAPVVAQAFAHPGALGPGAALVATLAFAAQLYCDFSGYTDMGRACAALLGYSVPENFASPYQSASPDEFWRRWHISLSSWLRDYLYIPLGGSRVARPRIYLNLMLTMALGGLWHGAAWHFALWGVYEGGLLCAHRLWSRTVGATAPYQRLAGRALWRLACQVCTFALICVGWIFFRAESIGAAFETLGAFGRVSRPFMAGLSVAPRSTPALALACAGAVVAGGWLWGALRGPALRLAAPTLLWMRRRMERGGMATVYAPLRAFVLRPAAYAAVVAVVALWPPQTVQRFIYFQF